VLVAAAVCPAAPVVVPDVAQAASGELDACRDACHDAIAAVLAERPDMVVVIGAGALARTHPAGTWGSLEPIGVPLWVVLGKPAAAETREGDAARLPVPLTVGAWLMAQHPATAEANVQGLEVAADESVSSCGHLGRGLADGAPRVGLVVIADGTARRGPSAPGYTDERSAAVDETWTTALATGSPDALMTLDPTLTEALMMAGRTPLQVLAGAAAGQSWRGALLWSGDPYGVQYAVASWLPDVP
jgi:hypothetical protein